MSVRCKSFHSLELRSATQQRSTLNICVRVNLAAVSSATLIGTICRATTPPVMRLSTLVPRQQLRRLQATSSSSFTYPPRPAAPPLYYCPTRLLATHSHPPRPSIGRIHPIPASSRSSPHDPTAHIPDMFDIPTADPPPTTPLQRILLSVRRSGRVVFAVCTAAAAVAALATLGYDLLLNPAHSAHSHSFHFIQHHPTAVALLGGGGRLIDMSDPMRGQLCHDTVRQVGDEQWAECRYRVRGDTANGGEGEVAAVLKRGGRGGWLVVYVSVEAVLTDGRKKRVVVCDYRQQVQREQQAAAETTYTHQR